MKILIVDDSRFFRTLLRDALALEGHVIFEAEDGQKGLQQLGRRKIDLIISDIAMPRLNGIELHRSVRKQKKYKTIPFVFISANKDQLDAVDLHDPKIDFKLSKGVSIEQFLGIIKKFGK